MTAGHFSTNHTHTTCGGEQVSLCIVVKTVSCLILVSGVLGNVLLLVVMWRRRRVRGFHNTFIANLALADLLLIVYSLPHYLLDLTVGVHPTPRSAYCRIQGLVFCTSLLVSSLSLVAVSFNRYVKVCHRPLFRRLFSARRNLAVCLCLWAFSGALHLPLLNWNILQPIDYDPASHICNARGVSKTPSYGSVSMLCSLLLPILLVTYFNLAILRRWLRSRGKVRKRRSAHPKATWKSFLNTSLSALAQDEDSCNRLGRDSDHLATMNRSGRCSAEGPSDSAPSFACSTMKDKLPDSNKHADDSRASARKAQSKAIKTMDLGVLKADPGLTNRFSDRPISETDACLLLMRGKFEDESDPKKRPGLNTLMLKPSERLTPTPRRAHSQRTKSCKSCASKWKASSKVMMRPHTSLARKVPSWSDFDMPTPDITVDEDCDDPNGTELEVTDSTVVTENSCSSEECERLSQQDRSCSDHQNHNEGSPGSSLYPSMNRNYITSLGRYNKKMRRKKAASDLVFVRSIVVIVSCLFLTYTPFVVTLILSFVTEDDGAPELPVTSMLFLFVNCAVNWVIYGILNTTFRQAYVNTLRGVVCCIPSRRLSIRSTRSAVSAVTSRFDDGNF